MGHDSEESPQDLADDASEADGMDFGDRAVPRWVRLGTWCGGIFAVLILYFIVYPQLLFRMDDVGIFDDSPEWVITTLEITIYPIIMMAEAMSFYARLAGVPI